MQILVLNSGSSSIKFSFFDAGSGEPLPMLDGEISGIGRATASFALRDAEGHDHAADLPGGKARIASMTEAIAFLTRALTTPGLPAIDAVGYRVVHPGAVLKGHQRVTPAVLDELRRASEFAPLHDPEAVKLIEAMQQSYPNVGHFVCFDTAFHRTMPPEASTYPISPQLATEGVHRYGFHGLSCESILAQLQAAKDIPFPSRMAIAHLGGGCSVTAVHDGRSIDNTMGMTPTGGVVMAGRPGDLDPGLVLFLLRHEGDLTLEAAAKLDHALTHSSGLAGLSHTSGDMREVRAAAQQGDDDAALALKVFTRSVRKAIGSFCFLLGGLDAIVFSGGIGENDAASRMEILEGLEPIGIALHPTRNSDGQKGLRSIGAEHSTTRVFVVPAKEDWMIARHVLQMTREERPPAA